MNKQQALDGEVFYPSEETIQRARLKNWDELAQRAEKDLEGFWAQEAKEL